MPDVIADSCVLHDAKREAELTAKDKAADARLRRVYGISLSDYDTMFSRQGGMCYICWKPPKPDKRLHVDHDHKVHKYKAVLSKNEHGGWMARVLEMGILVLRPSKKEARAVAKQEAKRRSVRGLLCWQDNAGLQKFRDNPDRLEAAAKYLRKFKEKGNQLG